MHLQSEHLKIVKDILRFYVPEYEIWAFGSRVHGRNLKEMSDLDLVVIADAPLPDRKLSQLRDAFSLSYLPFRVDVVDWSVTQETFREIIMQHYTVIQKGEEMPTYLETQPLENALVHLRDYYAKAINARKNNDGNFEAFRAATIQAFEYSYALCTKFLKRYLELTSDTNENADELTFSDRLRTGSERGLIRNQELWFTFREKRNITSHTYQEDKAEAVFTIMEAFEREASDLLMQLKSRNI